ncbi:MAG: hypothetical protein R3Y47_06565 [Lachnospiraceae bacterium]
MNIRIYLVSVEGLGDSRSFHDALACLDQTRYAKVCSYKRQKDQCLGIAAGLLLQVAYRGLLEGQHVEEKIKPYTVEELLGVLENSKTEIVYHENEFGKPYWDHAFANSQFFNISHSGEYVMLVCSDLEVGVDIQYKKTRKNLKHSVSTFSKMEAYVKCIGSGFAGEGLKGLDFLLHEESHENEFLDFAEAVFYELQVFEDYIAWICTRKPLDLRRGEINR